jgi:hypothetical protein
VLQEIKHTIRSLFRQSGFTIVATLTLALGIGANAAIFSFVNSLLLSNPPYDHADRLVRVMSQRGNEAGMLSGVLYLKSRLNDKATGRRIFNQEIIRNRVVFQFTRNTFVRSILEYDTLNRSISVSELFGYTPRPNTAVYVGYGDLLYNGFDPIAQIRSPGLFRLRRSFFIKLSYNYRYLFGNRRASTRNSTQGAANNVFGTE